jgi:type IV fimbrial biogenesis protein FimT
MLMKSFRQRGVSLVELVIAVAVLGVILAVAYPSFTLLLANQRIKTATESLRAGLQFARIEALRRGQGVSFDMSSLNSSWTVGCEIPVDDDNDGDGLPDCPGEIQFSASTVAGGVQNITITTDGGGVATFSPVGLVRQVNRDGSVPFTQINVTVPNISSAGLVPLRVVLPAGGLSRICDPAISDAGDTRKC